MSVNVSMGPAELQAGFRKSGNGTTLVVFEGMPQMNEALTVERVRDLAEALYQVARFAELQSHQAISLRY